MSKLTWEQLSSKYLLKENWATLRVDECRMPDGTIIPEYYVLEYPDWVNAVAITSDHEFILLKQYRHAAGEIILELPGGCIEKDESPEEAVKRELLEETGYEFENVEFISSIYANPATAGNKTHCFLAQGGKLVAEQKLDKGEEILIELVSLEKLKELLLNNKFGHALHTSGIFYALMRLGYLN